MERNTDELDFRIDIFLDTEQLLSPLEYPALRERFSFRITRGFHKYWCFGYSIAPSGPFFPMFSTPIHELLDLRDELFCASLQYEVFATYLYSISGRICTHVLRLDEIRFISEVFGALSLRCDFTHFFHSKKHGKRVLYISNSFLTDQGAYRNSCHAFLLPAGANCESTAERLLSRVGDADELDWDDQDIPGTRLSGIVDVEIDEVDAWLEKLPTHAASNIPAVSGDSAKENAASLLLLFQTNHEGYPWTLPKTLLDFLSANNLELCMLLVLETTYDGIQV